MHPSAPLTARLRAAFWSRAIRGPLPRPSIRRSRLAAEQLEARETPAAFAVDPSGSITVLAAGPSTGPGGDVVLVESSVPGADSFVRSVAPGSDAVLLDASGDGLSEARAFLDGRQNLGTVHIISHGGSGFLDLGSLQLDAAGSVARGDDLAALGAAVRTGGSVALYGCEVASGDAGAAFVNGVAIAAGRNVMASTHAVGPSALGGSWNLDYRAGPSGAVDGLPANVAEVTGLLKTLITVAGKGLDPNGFAGFSGDGGPATAALFTGPNKVAVDGSGNLFIGDSGNHRVRRVDAATGVVTTVAGNGTQGFFGDGGPATSAQLQDISGLAVDGFGNLFISDTGNRRIRKVNGQTGVISTYAGNGTNIYGSEGIPATSAGLGSPRGLAVDAAGNLSIVDYEFDKVRRVSASTGLITTVAGNGSGFAGDGGLATQARLAFPTDVAVDAAGNMFISDGGNFRIRKVTALTGIITTIAGTGVQGLNGDGGPATAAQLQNPQGVAVDAAGNVYVSEIDAGTVRVINAATQVLSRYAGSGNPQDPLGDGKFATVGTMNKPNGLAVKSNGNLVVADSYNQRVREIVPDVAPVLTAAAPPGGALGVAYTYQFKASGLPYPTFSANVLPPGLTLNATTGVLSGTPTAGGSFPFTITATNAVAPNSTANVTVSVSLASQMIAFALPFATTVYGVNPFTVTASGGGSGNPVTFAVVSGPGTVTGQTLRVTGAGDIVVEANQAGNGSYAAAPAVRRSLHVNPASLSVIADNATGRAGSPFPNFGYSVSGLKNGDSAAVVSGVALTTTATGASGPGSYPIVVSGGTAANYTLERFNGTLTLAAPLPPISPPPISPPPPASPPSSPVPVVVPGDVVVAFIGLGANPRVTTGDLDGNGTQDFIAVTSPGTMNLLQCLDGNTKGVLSSFSPFETSFANGLYVTVADVNGDGKADVIVTPDQGGGPLVVVYDGAKLAAGLTGDAAQIVRFYGIDDPAFRGGDRAAVARVNGVVVLVVSAGFEGGPRIAIFDARDVASGSSHPARMVPDFFAFEQTLRNGAFVATGDLTGDGIPDFAFGGGPNGAPRVRVFDGRKLLAAAPFASLDQIAGQAQLDDFFSGSPSARDGIRVSIRDVDGDGSPDLATQAGGGGPVHIYRAPNLLAHPADPVADRDIDPMSGVFVG